MHKYVDTWCNPIEIFYYIFNIMIEKCFSIVNFLLLIVSGIKCYAKLKVKRRIYLYQSSSIFISNKQLTLHKIYITFRMWLETYFNYSKMSTLNEYTKSLVQVFS